MMEHETLTAFDFVLVGIMAVAVVAFLFAAARLHFGGRLTRSIVAGLIAALVFLVGPYFRYGELPAFSIVLGVFVGLLMIVSVYLGSAGQRR